MPLVPRNQRVRGLLSDQRKSAGNGLLGPGLQPAAPGVSGQDATARGHRDANAESLPVLVGIRHRHNQERGGDTPEIRHMAVLHDGRLEFCRCVHSNLREVGAGNDGAVSRFLIASDLQELFHKVLYLWMKLNAKVEAACLRWARTDPGGHRSGPGIPAVVTRRLSAPGAQ